MGQPTGRSAGKVRVVRTKQFVGEGVILGLHQPALSADLDFQGVIFFRLGEVIEGQISVRRGREPEVEKSMFKRGVAMPAFHRVTPLNW